MIAEVNDIIDDAVIRYSEGMQKTANNIIRQITPKLNSLATDADGKIVRTPLVDTVAMEMTTIFNDGLNTAVVWGRLSRFVRDTIEPIDTAIRNYLKAVETDQSKALKIVTRERINSSLTPNRLSEAILPEAINVYYQLVGQQTKVNILVEEMQHKLGQRIEIFSRTVGATIVQTYSRDLNEVYAGQRKLQFVRFNGPFDDRNRDFCSERVGHYFHVEEVKEWVNLEWDGKIPGTNTSNIFSLLGGYNCRHILEYVDVGTVNNNEPSALKRAQRKQLL